MIFHWQRACLLIFLLNVSYNVHAKEMVRLPKGEFKSFFKGEGKEKVTVPSFFIDKYPVTNSDFNKFVLKNTKYKKNKIPKLFADEYYLKHWKGPLLSQLEERKIGQFPVIYVPWFVARKYCEAKGKRLPTIVEWEYAADGDNPTNQKLILEWYGLTNSESSLVSVRKSKSNKFGIYGMHGMNWELVEDFLTVMISSDSRSKGDRTDGLFCGGGSLNSRDSSKYATFMRYAFRSGLKGNYSGQNLGFRCAK